MILVLFWVRITSLAYATVASLPLLDRFGDRIDGIVTKDHHKDSYRAIIGVIAYSQNAKFGGNSIMNSIISPQRLFSLQNSPCHPGIAFVPSLHTLHSKNLYKLQLKEIQLTHRLY